MSITAEAFDEGFDDQEEGGLSGFYVLAIFLTLLAAFGVIVYFAYQKGLANAQASDGALPVVAADPSPVREEVPLVAHDDRRREVYDRLEGVAPTAVIAEVDADRDPLDGYASATPADAPADAPVEPPAVSEPVATATASVAVAPAEPRPAPTPVVAPATGPTPEPVVAPAPAAMPAGTHAVQVGAFGSDEEAMRFYATLSGRHGELVADRTPDVQAADVKGTTYHRLRLGPFTSKADASGYCADLKAAGQDCLVRAL